MPKSTKKRTKVKDLPQARQELTAKAAKRVKGGLLPAVQPQSASLSAAVQKVKKTGSGAKGSWDLGDIPGGLQ